MFTRSITDDSRSINDRSRVVRMTIISDNTTWSITYNCHSHDTSGAIYDHNILLIQVTG
jgi:hypothetical protein